MKNTVRFVAAAVCTTALSAFAQSPDTRSAVAELPDAGVVLASGEVVQGPAARVAENARTLYTVDPNDVAPPTTQKPLFNWFDRLTPYGYARVGAYYAFPLQEDQLLTSNGGFRLANLRLGMQLKVTDDLIVVTSIEASARRPNADDPTTGVRVVDLRDAYADWRLSRFAQLRVGQFKAPFYAETLLGDDAIPFITRSPVNDGVNPPEGFGPREPLTLDRQIGLQISSARLGGEAFGVRYVVAVVNGNGANQLFNDNNIVAPVGRVELDVFQAVTLGVNGYFNVKTEGIRTNRLNLSHLGYGVDLQAKVGDLRVLAGFVGRNSTFGAAVLPPDMGFGALGQLHYLFSNLGLEAAFRVSYFEPSVAQVDDQLLELAGMVGYRFHDWPVRVMLQYTHREEARQVAVPNDSVDAMVQIAW